MAEDEPIPGVSSLSARERFYRARIAGAGIGPGADDMADRAVLEMFDELHKMLRFLCQGRRAQLGPDVTLRLLVNILMAIEPDDREIWMHVEDGPRTRALGMLTLGQLKAIARVALQVLPLEDDEYRRWVDQRDVEERQRWQAHADRVKRETLEDVKCAVIAWRADDPGLFDILNTMKREPYKPAEEPTVGPG